MKTFQKVAFIFLLVVSAMANVASADDLAPCPPNECVGCFPDPEWGDDFCYGPHDSQCSAWQCRDTSSQYCSLGGGSYKLCYCEYCLPD
jgi:hypothetical protein